MTRAPIVRSAAAYRPTAADLVAAYGRAIPDVIAPGLRVLFVGINPSLYSGATGHHFARPGNRFWKVLHAAGFTDRVLSPHENTALVSYGIGVTNIVNYATARADELTPEQLLAGARRLRRNVTRYRPRAVAVLGVGAYQVAFARPRAAIGRQPGDIAGAAVWVLPNPSGLNANYQLPALAALYAEMNRATA